MNYYPEFAKMPVFTLNDATKIIGSNIAASRIMHSMISKGSVHRIRQNLYTCVDFGTMDDYSNRFQIASRINEDSFISYHSAFEFYGFYNQSYFDVQVCSLKKFKEFSYGDYHYRCYLSNSKIQTKTIKGTKIVTIERAIVDSIHMLGKVMDAEELVKCLGLIHKIDEGKIAEMLSIYGQERLYRKVGYVLSFYQNYFSISEDFFKFCKEKGVLSNKGYLVESDKNNLIFDSTWGLYTYGNLNKLSSKGGDLDV